MDGWVIVGRVGRPHGIRGEVVVELRTDEPDRRYADGVALTARSRRAGNPSVPDTLTVAGTRWHQGRLLARFEGVADRTAAEALRGTELTAPVDAADSPEDPDEFYDHQLIGLSVETVAGDAVGTIERIEHGAAQDLLVIRTPAGELLFPFVAALVPVVDVDKGRLVIDDAPGLLEQG